MRKADSGTVFLQSSLRGDLDRSSLSEIETALVGGLPRYNFDVSLRRVIKEGRSNSLGGDDWVDVGDDGSYGDAEGLSSFGDDDSMKSLVWRRLSAWHSLYSQKKRLSKHQLKSFHGNAGGPYLSAESGKGNILTPSSQGGPESAQIQGEVEEKKSVYRVALLLERVLFLCIFLSTAGKPDILLPYRKWTPLRVYLSPIAILQRCVSARFDR